MNRKPLITLENITVRVRDRHILAGTTWEIRRGENWAVLGPNGSGKSSLVRVLTGDTPHVHGSVIRHCPEADRRAIGYVSTELHEEIIAREEGRDAARYFSKSFDSLETARETILSGLNGRPFDPARFEETVERLGIRRLLDRGVRFLSSGEMRRVVIARALVKTMRLLVLDEPFSGIDAPSRAAISESLETMMRNGVQSVLVTHRPEEILPSISHVLLLKECRVIWKGPREDMPAGDDLARRYGREALPLVPDAAGTKRGAARTDTDPDVLVELRNATVRYGDVVVLDRLNWSMRKGEHWAVIGPNGSGKSTLLNLIYGDNLQSYANEVYLFGKRKGSGESVWDIKGKIGIVSSRLQAAYRRGISACDVVASGLFDSVGLYRRTTPDQDEEVRCWMGRLGIPGLAKRAFNQLSSGERRMVLLARAMVKSPLLLILDEPCEGLDRQNRSRLLGLVDAIGRETGTHLLYVTHYSDELPACITNTLRLGRKNG